MGDSAESLILREPKDPTRACCGFGPRPGLSVKKVHDKEHQCRLGRWGITILVIKERVTPIRKAKEQSWILGAENKNSCQLEILGREKGPGYW